MGDLSINNIRIAGTQPSGINPQQQQGDPSTQGVQGQAPAVTPKSADEILNFLSNSSIVCGKKGCEVKSNKIEVSKYVNADQASRIGQSVNQFFGSMETHVEKAMKEFNLPSDQAQNLISMHFNQQFDEADNAPIIASGQRLIIS